MKLRKTKSILVVALILFVLFLAPTISRMGSWNELKRWEAPPNTFGLKKGIYLSVEEMSSFFDVLHQYPTNRVIVSDGGYAFILYFEIPQYKRRKWLDRCTAIWSDSAVILKSAQDISLKIKKQAVIEQIGEENK